MKKQEKKDISTCACFQSKQGFTLVELLTVIAIIGILASVVLVSTQSGVEKSKRASAITTASSILPELVTCQDDSGGIAAPTSTVNGGGVICTAAGHSTAWPNISKSGWAYSVAADANISDGIFVYTITKSGQTSITCSLATNGCD